jgi:hypothetical protein
VSKVLKITPEEAGKLLRKAQETHNHVLVGTSSGAWFYPPEAMAPERRQEESSFSAKNSLQGVANSMANGAANAITNAILAPNQSPVYNVFGGKKK